MPMDLVGLGTVVLLHLQRPHPLPPGTQSRRSDTHLGGLALPPDLGPHRGHAPAPYPHLVLVAQCHLVAQHPTRGWGHDAGPATPCLLMSQSAAGNQTAEVGWDKGGLCWGASLLGPSPWGSTAHSKGEKLCPGLKAWSWVRDSMGQTPAAPAAPLHSKTAQEPPPGVFMDARAIQLPREPPRPTGHHRTPASLPGHPVSGLPSSIIPAAGPVGHRGTVLAACREELALMETGRRWPVPVCWWG